MSTRAVTAALACALAGCAVGPAFHRPPAPATAQYVDASLPLQTQAADGRPQRLTFGAPDDEAWWRAFGSNALNQAMADALAGSQDLAAARSRLAASQESLRAGYGAFLPQIDLGLAAQRERLAPQRLGQAGAGSIFNLLTVSGLVSYVVDVFGQSRRVVESLRAERERQRQLARATFTTLTANVANTLVARAAYEAEICALESAAQAARAQLDLTQVQLRAGIGDYGAVTAAEAQLLQIEAQIPALELKVDQANHFLAALTGHFPTEYHAIPLALAELAPPAQMQLPVPSELVRRRPDILIAEAELHEASAAIGIATADLLPSVVLSGDYGAVANRLRDLGDAAGKTWDAGASVQVPVFHGGALWHRRRAVVRAYEASHAAYRQTVLSAFQQVADSIQGLERTAQSARLEAETESSAKSALDIARANYDAGLVSYLAVVSALNAWQQARIAHLGATAARLQASIALYVALGGGPSLEATLAATPASPP